MAKIIKNGIEYCGNTDNKVLQTATSDNADYEVLFSGTPDNITRTEGAGKTNRLIYNPSYGRLMNKLTSVDASQSNNGVSGDTWQGIILGVDSNDRIISILEDSVRTDGRISTALLVRNYNTSGTQIGNKGITIYIDKSGNATYGVSDPANFRSAIGLGVNNISSQYTITKTSGNWKINEIDAVRSGNVVHMRIEMSGNGSSVSAGSNGFVGTITAGPLPALSIKLIAFYNNCPIMLNIEPDGAAVARVTATSVTVTSSGILALTGTFITNN